MEFKWGLITIQKLVMQACELGEWVRLCLFLVFTDARYLEAAVCIWTSLGFSLLAASGSGGRTLPRSCKVARTFLNQEHGSHSAASGTQKYCHGGVAPLLSLPSSLRDLKEEMRNRVQTCHWLIGPESPLPFVYMQVCLRFWSAQVWLKVQNASSDDRCILPTFWLPLVGSKSMILWKSKGLDKLTQDLCLVCDHSMNRPCPTCNGACVHGSRRESLEAALQTKQHKSAESDPQLKL